MQRSTATTRLGSYTINAQLVEKLTDFFNHTVPGMLSTDMSIMRASDNTSLTLVYPDHAVRYPRASDYHNQPFNGEIEGIQLELSHVAKFSDSTGWNEEGESYLGNPNGTVLKAIVVDLSFNKDRDNNYLCMAIQDDGADKELNAIQSGLFSILEQHRNNHRLIYRSEWFPPVVFLAAGLFGSLTFLIHTQPLRALFAILFGFCAYLFIFLHIKGYSEFETEWQRSWNAFLGWLGFGIAGAVLSILFFF
jgi:hypothetical protein